MKYLILNHIRGHIASLQSVLDKEVGNYDQVLVLGDITGTDLTTSEQVLTQLFKMHVSKLCEHFVCGISDKLIATGKAPYSLELPIGCISWMKLFLPVEQWEDNGFSIFMLTGSVEEPFRGISEIPLSGYFCDDGDLDIIILGNNLTHTVANGEFQTIICPGPVYDKNSESIKYAILEITESRVNTELKEIVRIF